MPPTSRELVHRTLTFDNPPRAPRNFWVLPWASIHHQDWIDKIIRDYPQDIIGVEPYYNTPPRTTGEMHKAGRYVDEWGCVFENVQDGIQGEVRDPLIKDWKNDAANINFPLELLTINTDAINRDCDASDQFILANMQPRPFERLQFFRGSENLYTDLLDPPPELRRLLMDLHGFYCEMIELWAAKTRVDAIFFLDDWGAQRRLLIHPDLWRDMFKPLYRDYIQIAHAHGKKAFMHSDGFITLLFPELIELGLDAINSQVFCMEPESLKEFAGKITFWGEMDRQHLLPHGTPNDIEAAVRRVRDNLWRQGGCIAQCEFGPGARPENVYQVFAAWDELTQSSS